MCAWLLCVCASVLLWLLQVLSGRLSVKSSNVRGSILVNGVASSIMKYRTLVGYVPQDDVMLYGLLVPVKTTATNMPPLTPLPQPHVPPRLPLQA